jgi:phage terminase large subunit-like protein
LAELILGIALPPSALERYCPHEPWPKQRAFLDLQCLEAFYGGAAAGGKSEALLMAALQYVHVPGYAALILRRDTQRLTLSGGLIPRAHAWFAGTGASWNGTRKTWSFPTAGVPSTISFGYLSDAGDKYRYGSSEYQYIAFDELTEFPEDDYLFLFSRLRKTTDMQLPLRMRSASNPGNVGHAWVKRRFIGESNAVGEATTSMVQWRNGMAYVPAQLADNPAVAAEAYCESLSHLPAVERERLMHGDWSIRADGLFRPAWLRYYDSIAGELRLLDAQGNTLHTFSEQACRRFVTIDPAGTSEERYQEQRGRAPCWSVAMVWDQPLAEQGRFLILREVRRERVGFDGLCHLLRELYERWRPVSMVIENEKLGTAAVDVLGRELPLSTIATGGRDKVARAAPLLVKWERGEIWLPRTALWRLTLESELLSWTGHPHETSDQIDAAAYAVQIAHEHSGPIRLERVFL